MRELLRELPDEAGRDLAAYAATSSRFAWLASLDRNPETRVLAIDGLADVCRQLTIAPFGGPIAELDLSADPAVLARAQAAVQVARPETRGDTWSDELLGPYRDALATLTERPLGGWVQRTLLVEDLTALYLVESEARARPWVADALRRAIGHCVRGVLLDTIRGRDRRLAEVRLCAMEQVRRLGGPRTVALMLAVMAASPEERAAGLPPFDPDALVQLRLIHYCGQLDAEAAQQAVRLPGQEAWQTTSPAEFLARTVLSETGYYSKLRTPALVALAWCLRRPSVDPDPGWVREWLESRGA